MSNINIPSDNIQNNALFLALVKSGVINEEKIIKLSEVKKQDEINAKYNNEPVVETKNEEDNVKSSDEVSNEKSIVEDEGIKSIKSKKEILVESINTLTITEENKQENKKFTNDEIKDTKEKSIVIAETKEKQTEAEIINESLSKMVSVNPSSVKVSYLSIRNKKEDEDYAKKLLSALESMCGLTENSSQVDKKESNNKESEVQYTVNLSGSKITSDMHIKVSDTEVKLDFKKIIQENTQYNISTINYSIKPIISTDLKPVKIGVNKIKLMSKDELVKYNEERKSILTEIVKNDKSPEEIKIVVSKKPQQENKIEIKTAESSSTNVVENKKKQYIHFIDIIPSSLDEKGDDPSIEDKIGELSLLIKNHMKAVEVSEETKESIDKRFFVNINLNGKKFLFLTKLKNNKEVCWKIDNNAQLENEEYSKLLLNNSSKSIPSVAMVNIYSNILEYLKKINYYSSNK